MQPAKVRMHVALGYQGDMEIELIEDLRPGASPYRSAAGCPSSGMHHVAWFSDDVAADVGARPARGMQVCFEAANEVTRVAYLEDPREPRPAARVHRNERDDARGLQRAPGRRAHLAGR